MNKNWSGSWNEKQYFVWWCLLDSHYILTTEWLNRYSKCSEHSKIKALSKAWEAVFLLQMSRVQSERHKGCNISCSNSLKKPTEGESQSQDFDPCRSILVLATTLNTGTKYLGRILSDQRISFGLGCVWKALSKKGTSRLSSSLRLSETEFTYGYSQASVHFRRNAFVGDKGLASTLPVPHYA